MFEDSTSPARTPVKPEVDSPRWAAQVANAKATILGIVEELDRIERETRGLVDIADDAHAREVKGAANYIFVAARRLRIVGGKLGKGGDSDA